KSVSRRARTALREAAGAALPALSRGSRRRARARLGARRGDVRLRHQRAAVAVLLARKALPDLAAGVASSETAGPLASVHLRRPLPRGPRSARAAPRRQRPPRNRALESAARVRLSADAAARRVAVAVASCAAPFLHLSLR